MPLKNNKRPFALNGFQGIEQDFQSTYDSWTVRIQVRRERRDLYLKILQKCGFSKILTSHTGGLKLFQVQDTILVPHQINYHIVLTYQTVNNGKRLSLIRITTAGTVSPHFPVDPIQSPLGPHLANNCYIKPETSPQPHDSIGYSVGYYYQPNQ